MRSPESSADSARAPRQDLRAAVATAEAWAPGWRTLVLTLPRPDARVVRVEVQGGRTGQPHRTGFLTVDAATGSVHEWESFADDTPGRRAQQFLRYAHTGEYWGLGGQLLAGLFSLAAALMVWTGLSLAVRRLRRFVQVPAGAARIAERGAPALGIRLRTRSDTATATPRSAA